MDKLVINSSENQIAIPHPYREIVRVEKCRSCEKKHKRKKEIVKAVGAGIKPCLIGVPWIVLLASIAGQGFSILNHFAAIGAILGGFSVFVLALFGVLNAVYPNDW
jgi:hypothetical protein